MHGVKMNGQAPSRNKGLWFPLEVEGSLLWKTMWVEVHLPLPQAHTKKPMEPGYCFKIRG